MLRFAVFALLVAAASAISTNGVVEGLVPCGSEGEVIEVRVTDCTRLPCQLTIGGTYDIEVDFRPHAAHETIFVRVSVIRGGQETIIVDDEIPAHVEPGRAYTLAYPWTVRGDFFGLVSLRIQLYNDQVTELCGLATAEVRQPFYIPY